MLSAFAQLFARLASAESRARTPARVTRSHVLALLLVVVASLAYRLYVSEECSLWLDEATTARVIDSPLPELLRGPEREHPPLMYWLVRFATALVGRGDTGLRSVSLLFGCVLLVAVYFLCVELGLGATRALVPPAWLALTPFFIRYATEARHYAIVGAFTTLATVYALRLLRGPFKTSSFVGLAVCSAAGAATQFFALPYAFALWGAVVVGTAGRWQLRALTPRERTTLIAVVAGSLVVFGALAVEIVLLVHFYASHALHGSAHHHLAPAVVWQQFSFLARPPWDPAREAVVAACGLCWLAVRRRGIGGLVPLALAFLPVASAHLLLSGGHMLTPRYLWPSFVFYQLGDAAAVLGLIELFELAVVHAGARLHASALARGVTWLGWLVLLLPLHARVAEFPSGFGAGGPVNYRGLQAYFRGPRAADTALVVFVGYAGLRLMGTQYQVPRLTSLESFTPIPGVERYLVAEFGSSNRDYLAKLGPLLREHFGLSLRQWRALRPVRLPGDRFQRGERARLVILDKKAHAEPAAGRASVDSTQSETPSEARDDANASTGEESGESE